MNYQIKNHPTLYRGTLFRSRLEARWAAFFDLAGWKWEYEPIDLPGWAPDFRITFPCCHSECNGEHSILAEVKPFFHVSQFDEHVCSRFICGTHCETGHVIPADASAGLGSNPGASIIYCMSHGAGGGEETLYAGRIHDVDTLWRYAGNTVQWHKT